MKTKLIIEKVTATIGPHVLTEESSSANDRCFKDRLKSVVAASLARRIAAIPPGSTALKITA